MIKEVVASLCFLCIVLFGGVANGMNAKNPFRFVDGQRLDISERTLSQLWGYLADLKEGRITDYESEFWALFEFV